MNDTPKLETFFNQEFGNIRIIQDGDMYLFCGSDVTNALGYANSSKAIGDHCREDGVTIRYTIDNLGRRKKQNFVTEGNVYRLIARSKLPAAERFESWIFDEVMPTIRKHGAYVTDNVLNDPELLEKIMETLKAEQRRNAELEGANRKMLPKVTYYDIILRSENAVPITLFAKDYGMSATRMNRILNALEIQYKVRGCWMLYQKYANQGFTVTHTYISGPRTTTMHTCWTQKGRRFLYELLAEHGIRPVIEILD